MAGISTGSGPHSLSLDKLPSQLHRIHLTEAEEKLFDVLIQCAERVSDHFPGHRPVMLRVAGGWVRDKLLGKDSEDIDIAIDTMKGEPFAAMVHAHMEKHHLPMGHVTTIQINPEKSKHLETANAKVFGYLVDFVHLRTETYLEDTRNPQVDFGTPLEDALRRDITINALFYNLHTKEVEDFTGKGLDDLASGHVRTPLPAYQTFVDDPLRVLRVIRFATRFGYTVDEDILNAITKEDIKLSFQRKITRERIGVEFNKMMKSQDPVRAIRMLNHFRFYDLVFDIPNSQIESAVHGDETLALHAAWAMDQLLRSTVFSKLEPPEFDKDDRRILFMTCAMAPFVGIKGVELCWNRDKTQSVKKVISLGREVIARGVKLSALDADKVGALLELSETVDTMIQQYCEHAEGVDRCTLGMFVRSLGARPLFNKWKLAMLYSLVLNVARAMPPDMVERSSAAIPTIFDSAPYNDLANQYVQLIDRIQQLDLQSAHDFRPALNGKEIAQILGIKPGPSIGEYLNSLVRFQLGRPCAGRAECVEYVKQLQSGKPEVVPDDCQKPPPRKKRETEAARLT
ncbi:CCA tRNA nucleotidyltransferase, mitochondrial [Gaertneriomyces sp. JEL0708]|nr:CCA tRNA nucleotidyltransferase, mitochondrial [Gaertneriomyces sp. JEL0708]